MTAGSYMYIGPQGIVHGTTITLLNAARLHSAGTHGEGLCHLRTGGMSGAQPKAAVIAGMVCVAAEINPKAIRTRKEQGWVDEVYDSLPEVIDRMLEASGKKKPSQWLTRVMWSTCGKNWRAGRSPSTWARTRLPFTIPLRGLLSCRTHL